MELLQHSSVMVEVFKDPRPLSTLSDPRIKKLQASANYFSQFVGADPTLSFTTQTSYDIMSSINGFIELLHNCIPLRLSLVPAYINSDAIENHFCMVRSLFNGASDHPAYYAYSNLQNSIILTQPPGLPKKRNANDSFIEVPAANKKKLSEKN